MKGKNLNKDRFEKDLKKAAEEFKMQPSEKVWAGIQQEIQPSKKKVLPFWRGAAAAAALLLLMGLGAYLLYPSVTNNTPSERNPGYSMRKTIPSKKKGEHKENQNKNTDKHELDTNTYPELAKKDHSNPDDNQQQINTPYRENKEIVSKNKWNSHEEEQKEIPLRVIDSRAEFKPLVMETTYKEMNFSPSLQYPEDMVEYLLGKKRGKEPLLAVHNRDRSVQKVSFGAYFTTGMSYRTLRESNQVNRNRMNSFVQNALTSETGSQERNERNDQKVPLQHKQDLGWNAGLSLGIPLVKNVILKTGLSVQRTEYKITGYKYITRNQSVSLQTRDNAFLTTAPSGIVNNNSNNRVEEFVMNTNEGNRQPISKQVGLKNEYLNAEIPLLVGYRFGSPDKLSFIVMAGAGVTYLLNANTVRYDNQLQHYYPDDKGNYLRNLNSNLIFNINVGIPLSEHLQFEVGPSFQYQLFSSYKADEPVAEFPYLIGLKTKIQLR